MKEKHFRIFLFVLLLIASAFLYGCGGMKYTPGSDVMFSHKELPEADMAVSAAKEKGKDKECPDYFNKASQMRDDAYETYWACRTDEAIEKAKAAKALAESLCPEEPLKDSDGDGIPDNIDRCPDTPKGVKVDSKGCPLDSDGDGVYDYKDKCPGTPKGVKVDEKGCPPDSDRDGVYDYKDKCPDTPYGAKVDFRGCWVLGGVNFDIALWEIKAIYHNSLEQVVDVLRKNPDLNVEIQGHTDNTGSKEYNQGLSEKRAASVKDYLIKKGINGNRLTTKGYGLTRPIATNETPEGKAKNRRVELHPVK